MKGFTSHDFPRTGWPVPRRNVFVARPAEHSHMTLPEWTSPRSGPRSNVPERGEYGVTETPAVDVGDFSSGHFFCVTIGPAK